METMNLRPDLLSPLVSFRIYTTLTTFHLELSTFALQCMDYAIQDPASPGSLTLSNVSQLSAGTLLSKDRATTVVFTYTVSDYERTSYYNGITDGGEHPDLLYRTGSAKYPWIQPSGRHAYQPTKSIRGVYRTPTSGALSVPRFANW